MYLFITVFTWFINILFASRLSRIILDLGEDLSSSDNDSDSDSDKESESEHSVDPESTPGPSYDKYVCHCCYQKLTFS